MPSSPRTCSAAGEVMSPKLVSWLASAGLILREAIPTSQVLLRKSSNAVAEPWARISITRGADSPGRIPCTRTSSSLSPGTIFTSAAPWCFRKPSARAGARAAPMVFDPLRRSMTLAADTVEKGPPRKRAAIDGHDKYKAASSIAAATAAAVLAGNVLVESAVRLRVRLHSGQRKPCPSTVVIISRLSALVHRPKFVHFPVRGGIVIVSLQGVPRRFRRRGKTFDTTCLTGSCAAL